jgi:hypothetical protein
MGWMQFVDKEYLCENPPHVISCYKSSHYSHMDMDIIWTSPTKIIGMSLDVCARANCLRNIWSRCNGGNCVVWSSVQVYNVSTTLFASHVKLKCHRHRWNVSVRPHPGLQGSANDCDQKDSILVHLIIVMCHCKTNIYKYMYSETIIDQICHHENMYCKA